MMQQHKKIVPYRVIFFGTPDFSVPALQALVDHHQFDVIAAVTQPDKPVGRSQALSVSPVKAEALSRSIPVLQPGTLNQKKEEGQAFLEKVRHLSPDIGIVVAYGNIIPPEILSIPTHGFINIHASLLPRLRGASPIQHAILNGHAETGVTIMVMDQGLDTGPILAQQSVPLGIDETCGTLHEKLKHIGPQVLMNALPGYITGTILPTPQNPNEATTCGMIKKEHGLIDWTAPPEYIERHIRAYHPWPGSYTMCKGKRIKILKAHLEDAVLIIELVQPEGKKPMRYDAFIRGYSDCRFPGVGESS